MNSKGRKENRNYRYELLLRVAYANKLLSSSSLLANILFRVKRISYRESKQHFISWAGFERFLVCVITKMVAVEEVRSVLLRGYARVVKREKKSERGEAEQRNKQIK